MLFIVSAQDFARLMAALAIVAGLLYLSAPVWMPISYFYSHGLILQMAVVIVSCFFLLFAIKSFVQKRWVRAFIYLAVFALLYGYSMVRMSWRDDMVDKAIGDLTQVRSADLSLDRSLSMEGYLLARVTGQNNWLDYMLACQQGGKNADINMFDEKWNTLFKTTRVRKCGSFDDIKQAYGVDLAAFINRDFEVKRQALQIMTTQGFNLLNCEAQDQCERQSSFAVKYKPLNVVVPFMAADVKTVQQGDPAYADWMAGRDMAVREQKALLDEKFDDPFLCAQSTLCFMFRKGELGKFHADYYMEYRKKYL